MHVFKKKGKVNTKKTLDLALERAKELGIETFLVATTSGETGLVAAEMFKGKKVMVVTHSTGFSKPGVQEADASLIEKSKKAGAEILTATHAFGGVGRAIRRKLGTYQVDEVIAYTLRMFGQGTKVAVEMAVMAADAGLVSVEDDLIAIAGTGTGADTAVVLRPAHAQDLFDVRIREIICWPY
jgi:hypothetical protein